MLGYGASFSSSSPLQDFPATEGIRTRLCHEGIGIANHEAPEYIGDEVELLHYATAESAHTYKFAAREQGTTAHTVLPSEIKDNNECQQAPHCTDTVHRVLQCRGKP